MESLKKELKKRLKFHLEHFCPKERLSSIFFFFEELKSLNSEVRFLRPFILRDFVSYFLK